MNIQKLRKDDGAVLIFVLWVLSFLAVLAVNLGYGIRQKIIFMKRIEARSQMNHIVEGGVKVAQAVLFENLQKSEFQYTSSAKIVRHNNRGVFEDIRLGDGVCEVSYQGVTDDRKLEKRFGVIDEESKINVNTAHKLVLKKIIGLALSFDEESSTKMAEAIIDWRQSGDSELKGFFSDDYYANLQFPYPKKSEPFEMIAELLLVKGIDREMFDVLVNYLTVYGDGLVNINTVSKPVLMALGLDDAIADKLLKVRRGIDGSDNTIDDHIFYRTYDIAAEVASVVKLETEEARAIDQLNLKGSLTTNSYYYTIQSNAFSERSNDRKSVVCVLNSKENSFIYWNEK